ncbi:PucR family transcriptional regulator [Streptomyces sp. P1-3]|uniref:PucR family transcriptional regulator n=1 Tax=Streptomyces sp. P1-3 TaxID=3421658 RepID=UPI003D35DB3C
MELALLVALGYRTVADEAPSGAVPKQQRGGREIGPGPAALTPTVAPAPAPNPTPAPVPAPVADRTRQALFEALVGDPARASRSLPELARSARWPLPDTVQAVVLAAPGELPRLSAAMGDLLVGAVDNRPCLLIPDPGQGPEARTALETALRGRSAAVGHTVPLYDAASSLRWARRLLSMAPVDGGPEGPVVFVDDHLSTLLLLQDESLARALAARWLRPLTGLTPRQSERLEETLLAWLEGGGAPEAAKALHVHPQTVRYRLRQIEKLFGPGLRDPRTRFELELALRSRRLMAQVRRQRARVTRRARTMAGGVTSGMTGGRRLALGIAREARVNGL